MMDEETFAASPTVITDTELAQLQEPGEPGVADVLRVFEEAERLYFAAVATDAGPQFKESYSTGTLAL